MDSSRDENCDQNYQTDKTPIVCSQDAGKVLIQLEGSHTTSTTTESPPSLDKKNVKFQDRNEKLEAKNEDILREADTSISKMNLIEAICSATANAALDFDKNVKRENIELRHFGPAGKVKPTSKFRSVTTTTENCDVKNVACQTQLSDVTSLNELSLLEISSLTSRSEQATSLNNYAQAENACVSTHDSQQEIMKRPLVGPVITLSADTPQLNRTPSFNIITIETDATPSPTELRRAPLCHRLWDVLSDFCAAIFLCLQVNRDCISCLGFFAAFVVSASFLTAFFYHTLVMSPALWQTADNSYL